MCICVCAHAYLYRYTYMCVYACLASPPCVPFCMVFDKVCHCVLYRDLCYVRHTASLHMYLYLHSPFPHRSTGTPLPNTKPTKQTHKTHRRGGWPRWATPSKWTWTRRCPRCWARPRLWPPRPRGGRSRRSPWMRTFEADRRGRCLLLPRQRERESPGPH